MRVRGCLEGRPRHGCNRNSAKIPGLKVPAKLLTIAGGRLNERVREASTVFSQVNSRGWSTKLYMSTALHPFRETTHGLTRYARTCASNDSEARVQCRRNWRTRPSLPRRSLPKHCLANAP